MYSSEETKSLVYAELSKSNEKESETSERSEYDTYDNDVEVNALINTMSSKSVMEEVVAELKLIPTWSYVEQIAIIEGVFDPRNFGRVENYAQLPKAKTGLNKKLSKFSLDG